MIFLYLSASVSDSVAINVGLYRDSSIVISLEKQLDFGSMNEITTMIIKNTEMIIASPAGDEKNSVDRTCFLNQEIVSENQPDIPVFFFFGEEGVAEPL